MPEIITEENTEKEYGNEVEQDFENIKNGKGNGVENDFKNTENGNGNGLEENLKNTENVNRNVVEENLKNTKNGNGNGLDDNFKNTENGTENVVEENFKNTENGNVVDDNLKNTENGTENVVEENFKSTENGNGVDDNLKNTENGNGNGLEDNLKSTENGNVVDDNLKNTENGNVVDDNLKNTENGNGNVVEENLKNTKNRKKSLGKNDFKNIDGNGNGVVDNSKNTKNRKKSLGKNVFKSIDNGNGNEAEESTIEVLGDGVFLYAYVGDPSDFVVATSDCREHVTCGLVVAFDGPEKPYIQFDHLKNGDIGVTYVPRVPGKYTLTVKFNNKHVRGSPFKITVINHGSPVAEPVIIKRNIVRKVKMSGLGMTEARVNETAEIYLDISRAEIDSDPTVLIRGPMVPEYTAVEKTKGTITLAYTPTEVGEYTFWLSFRGENVPGCPFTVSVK